MNINSNVRPSHRVSVHRNRMYREFWIYIESTNRSIETLICPFETLCGNKILFSPSEQTRWCGCFCETIGQCVLDKGNHHSLQLQRVFVYITSLNPQNIMITQYHCSLVQVRKLRLTETVSDTVTVRQLLGVSHDLNQL